MHRPPGRSLCRCIDHQTLFFNKGTASTVDSVAHFPIRNRPIQYFLSQWRGGCPETPVSVYGDSTLGMLVEILVVKLVEW